MIKKRGLAIFLVALMFTCSVMTGNGEAKALKITFKKAGELPSAHMHGTNSNDKFYNSQAFAFNTYTKKDGYAFTLNNNRKRVKVTHMRFVKGKFTEKKSVYYTKKQLDHANDATVYKQGKETYILVARGGINNNKTLGMIKLSDFKKGKAKVYTVKLKNMDTNSTADLRGVAYAGKRKVKIGKKNVKKQTIIVEYGRILNLMYVKSIKKNVITLDYADSQRIQAPKIEKREGTANGIVYHNGKVFMAYADEGKGGINRNALIDVITIKELFGNANPNSALKPPLNCKKDYDYHFATEAVFFVKHEGKDYLYMTCNGGEDSDHFDYIYKSVQKF